MDLEPHVELVEDEDLIVEFELQELVVAHKFLQFGGFGHALLAGTKGGKFWWGKWITCVGSTGMRDSSIAISRVFIADSRWSSDSTWYKVSDFVFFLRMPFECGLQVAFSLLVALNIQI